jgi:hypothetical protein
MRDMDDLCKYPMSATRVPGLGISFTIIFRKANTVEPRYNNEHRAFNSYSYNEVIAISNQGLSDHVPHHL